MEEKEVTDERPKLGGVGAARRQNLEVTVPSIGWKLEKVLACERSCGPGFLQLSLEVRRARVWNLETMAVRGPCRSSAFYTGIRRRPG